MDLDDKDEISTEPFVKRPSLCVVTFGLEPVNSDNRFGPGGNNGRRPPPGAEFCFCLEEELLDYIRAGHMGPIRCGCSEKRHLHLVYQSTQDMMIKLPSGRPDRKDRIENMT